MFDPRIEARRWWDQAQDDLLFVRAMTTENRFFDKACFVAQQAAEKAVKACLYAGGRREVVGHSVGTFVRQLLSDDPNFSPVVAAAARLDRYYIPTRYPNGLPGGTPFQSFTADDLTSALRDAEQVFAATKASLITNGVISA